MDEERAHHIRWDFEAYATGQWSVVEITEELERRGLKTRTSRRYVGSPLSRSAVHRMLSNPCYIGKHEPTIDEETFLQVQIRCSRTGGWPATVPGGATNT